MKESVAVFCAGCGGIDMVVMISRAGNVIFFCSLCMQEAGGMEGGDPDYFELIRDAREEYSLKHLHTNNKNEIN